MPAQEASLASAPTMEQAKIAAGLLRDEGASAVLLFGSMAEAKTHPESDIDLVAIFDDINYEERLPLRWSLEATCHAATGQEFDVHVTDWPEWKHRVSKVGSSFEARIAKHAQVLFSRDPDRSRVRWGKEIGMADSDLQESLSHVSAISKALGEMATHCRLRDDETTKLDADTIGAQTEFDLEVRHERLVSLCSCAAMVVETSLKALTALSGTAPTRSHNVKRLLSQLPTTPSQIAEALEPLHVNTVNPSAKNEFDDLSGWRIAGTYPPEVSQPTLNEMEHLALLITNAAVVCAQETIAQISHAGADPTDERLARCQQRLNRATQTLSSGNIAEGIGADQATSKPTT